MKINKYFKLFKTLFLSVTLVAILAFVPTNTLKAQVSFEGKTVEWIIPFSAGGGSDKWARFYAPLLSEALPGKPNVVVKNMPGGGSTTGANYFAARAKPDGLTIFGSSGSTQLPFLLDDPRVKYKYKDWKIVLGTPTGGVVYVSPSTGVDSFRDIGKLRGKNMKYGSQGATSLDLVPLLAFEILELDVDAVMGMKGRGDGRLAFERGETLIDYQTTSSYLKSVVPMVKEGTAIPLFSYGILDAKGKLQRDPTFPDIPHFAEAYEIMHGKAPKGKAFEAWKNFFAAGFAAQKMVFLPKRTSAKIVKTYENAFNKVISAPDFPTRSAARLGKYPQGTGKTAKTMQKTATSVKRSSKTWIKKWLKDKYNVNL